MSVILAEGLQTVQPAPVVTLIHTKPPSRGKEEGLSKAGGRVGAPGDFPCLNRPTGMPALPKDTCEVSCENSGWMGRYVIKCVISEALCPAGATELWCLPFPDP